MSKKDKNRLNRHGLKRFDKHCPLWSAYVWPEGASLECSHCMLKEPFMLLVKRSIPLSEGTQSITQRG